MTVRLLAGVTAVPVSALVVTAGEPVPCVGGTHRKTLPPILRHRHRHLLVLLLVGGTAGSLWLLVRHRRQEQYRRARQVLEQPSRTVPGSSGTVSSHGDEHLLPPDDAEPHW